MTHPSDDLLTQYAVGEAVDVEDHLTDCERCAQRVELVRQLLGDAVGESEESYEETPSRRLERERDAALRVIMNLPSTPDAGLRDRLLESAELRTEGGALELIGWIPQVRWSNPRRALIAASSVVDLVRSLDYESPSMRLQLEAGALRELASTHRTLAAYENALNLLRQAESIAAKLPISDVEMARVWYERGRVFLELGECGEAREWASLAAEGFRRFADQRRVNRSQYMIAASYFNEGSPAASAEAFSDLLEALRDDGDEVTIACVKSALGHISVRSGDVAEACELLQDAAATFRGRGMPVDALRSEWGMARVAMAEGRFEVAVETLRDLIDRFSRLDLAEEASLARLDLYESLLILGRIEEAEVEVRKSLEVLSGRFSRREQQRALSYLREISELRETQPDHVREVCDFLDLSRVNPKLSFSPPAS